MRPRRFFGLQNSYRKTVKDKWASERVLTDKFVHPVETSARVSCLNQGFPNSGLRTTTMR